MNADLRERVAAALWENNRLDGRQETYPYEQLTGATKDDLLWLTDAVLEAIRDEGLVVADRRDVR